MRESDEKKLSLDGKRKANIHEKKDDNGADSLGSKQSSPVKSSKLPPVCLRVDPLPKKKSINGSSRSPSPPSRKGEESAQKEKEQIIQTENAPKEKIHKTVPVVFVKGVPEKNAEEVGGEKYGGKSKDGYKGKVDRKAFEEAKLEKEKQVVKENKECKEKIKGGEVEERKQRMDFSEAEAATLIQSAYRGYEVRKWQPLQKLRNIKRVQEQVGEVRKRIESLGASSEMDAKQRMIIGETIMNLLLQLDTIQGLHPSVREVRKSVAKELICLQEKLDSLSQQSTTTDEFVKVEERSTNKDAEEQASLATSEQVCGEGSDENHVASFAESEKSGTVQCKHEEISEEGEAKESASEESMQVKDDIVFTSPNGYKDVPDALFSESESASEVPSIAVEEGMNPPASLVPEAEEAVSAPREAPAETEGAYSVKIQASDSVAGKDIKSDKVKAKTLDGPLVAVENKEEAEDSNLASTGINIEGLHLVQEGSLRKSSVNSSESGNTQAVAVSQETECTADFIASAEPSTEEKSTNSDASAPLAQNIEADTKQEELETAQFTGENAPNSQATPPVAQNIEVDTKQEELEPQTLPSVEESSVTANASEVKAVDEYTSTAALVHPETEDLGTFTEPKKNLEMHLIENDSTLVQDSALSCDGDRNSGENLENGSEMSKTVGANFNECVEQRQEDAHCEEPTSEPPIEAPVKDEDTKGLKEEGAESTAEILSVPTVNSIPTINMSNEEKLMEENEKLREMLRKLLDSGKEHLAVISDLGDRVKELERKLAKKKRVKVAVNKLRRSSPNTVACH
nr:unnamed protein product [Ananas comosus var. bracteatus]